MTYPSPAAAGGDTSLASPAPVGRPPRPWSVQLAVALVVTTLAALLLSTAVGVEEWLRTADLIDQAARTTGATPEEVSDERGIVPALYVVMFAVHVVLVLVFAGLALPVWRGRDSARIALCVVSGVSSLCCGSLVALAAALPEQPETSAFGAELSRLEEASSPAWTDPAGIASALVVALVPLAVLILLLLTASNRFFRPPQPVAAVTPGFHYPSYPYHYGYGYHQPYPGSPAPPGPPMSAPAPPAQPSSPPGSSGPSDPPLMPPG